MAKDLPEAPLAADLAARVESLPDLVNGDETLIRRGRFLTVEMLVELGHVPYYVSIERGRIASLARGPAALRSWRFALRAGEAAWRRFWQAEPEPHYHDLFAMAKRGEMRIEGDLAPFMANLLYFKDVLAAPRRAAVERRA
jgi:hypothetical protein